MSDAITRKEAYLKSIGDGTSSALKPITREEHFLSAIANGGSLPFAPITRKERLYAAIIDGTPSNLKPITREELYLAYIAGETSNYPLSPITRSEFFLDSIAQNGGGSSPNDDFLESGVCKIVMDVPEYSKAVTLNFRQPTDNGVKIEWGDGTITDKIIFGVNGQKVTHFYEIAKRYVIRMTNVLGWGTMELGISSSANSLVSMPKVAVKKLYVSGGRTNHYCCYGCDQLEEVICDGVNTLYGEYAFAYCLKLNKINIPDEMKVILLGMFEECASLTTMEFPKSIVSISSSAFSGCRGMKKYDFSKNEKVPTLANISAFRYIPADCQILVPSALYDEWIVATNWATYASNIVAV